VQSGILSGPCGGPYTSLGCAATPSGNNCFEIASIPLVAGTTYYIVNDGDAGADCTWDINVCFSACVVTPDVGTFTITQNGNPVTSPIYLCEEGNDCLSFVSNDDYVLPPPFGCEISEVMWLIYTAAPTTSDPATDPGYSGSMWTGEDFADCNVSTYGFEGTNGGHLWFVPITADDGDNGGDPNSAIHWDQDGDGCFDLGTAIEVYYLKPITFTTTSSSCAGTVSVTVSGGQPEANASNYTITNTGLGTLTGTPITHAGTVTITGLTDSQAWSLSIADGNGCSASVNGTFSGDVILPQIVCPGNITVNNTVGSCGAIVNYSTPVGTDNCPGVVTTLTAGMASGSTFPIGTTTVTYAVDDVIGNGPVSCSFTVTVVDSEAPQITCPGNITVNNTAGSCGAIVNYSTPVGTDNCAGATTTLTAGMASGSTFPVGTTTVTYAVNDAAGNGPVTCSFTVTVVDSEAPQITCPGNITVNNTVGSCGALVNYSAPVGTDNCAGAVTTLTAGMASGSTFPVGTTTVTYAVNDAAGNGPVSCSFTVTVVDNEAPQIICPGNIAQCNPVATWVAPVGTDNCGGPITTQTQGGASGSSFSVGVTTVEYTVTDAVNNTTTCSFTVEIYPQDDPSFAFSLGTYCLTGSDPIPVVTGVTGGTFTISAPGVFANATTGEIDLSASGLGTFGVTYTTNGVCPAFEVDSVTITSAPSANFNYDAAQYCQDSLNPMPIYGVGASGGGYSFTANDPLDILVLDATSGEIDLVASEPGVYTVYNVIPASGGCASAVDSAIIEILQVDSALFSYSRTTYCLTENDTFPMFGANATQAGVFTILPSGTINSATGEIDFSATGIGQYTVVYSTPISNSCPAVDSVIVNITPAPTAAFSYDAAQYCQDSINPVLTVNTGASTGVFSASPTGLIIDAAGNITLSTSAAGIYTVYNNVAAGGGCAAVIDSTTIEVLQVDSALFIYSNTRYCLTANDTFPTFGINATLGGVFTILPSGVINSATGEIDFSATGVGNYTIYYNTDIVGNACFALDSFNVEIVGAPTAAFSYDAVQYCQDSIDPILTVNIGASTGVFSASSAGLIVDAAGNITLSTSTAGVYTVYNSVAAGGGCAAVIDSTTIEVLQVDDASFAYANGNTYCEGDVNPVASNGGTTGGVFTISPLATINSSTGEIDLLASGVGVYTVIYSTPVTNNCAAVDSLTIIINPQNTVVAGLSNPICFGDDVTLTAVGSGNGSVTWYSDFLGVNSIGSGSPLVVSPSSIGTITYYVNEAGTCSSGMDSVVVIVGGVVANINANPLSGAIPLNVTLDGSGSTGAITGYSWTYGDGGSGNQSIESNIYSGLGTYVVELIVTDGICSDTTSITIDAFGESTVLIPNVFTPNDDGSNDIFTIDGVNLESVECQIYNRWGQLMYSWSNVKGYWDGRTLSGGKAPDGSYFYVIDAKGFDGTEYSRKGSFSLIR